MIVISNLIPEKICLSCDICCRYTEDSNQWTPFILKEELPGFKSSLALPPFVESSGLNIDPVKDKNNYICPFFVSAKNRCRIYPERPLDCRLYPFVISYDSTYSQIILSCDRQCPFAADKKNAKKIEKYARSLKNVIDAEEMAETIYLNRGLIMPYNDSFLRIFKLDKATHKIFKVKSGLKAITIDDKFIFNEFINRVKSKTYSCNFAHIYCWKDIAHISWIAVDGNLLVFWSQGDDYFLLLPPLGEKISAKAIEYMKKICVQTNFEPIIENVNKKYAEGLMQRGFKAKSTGNEYIYCRAKISSLSGGTFKSQRWSYNYLNRNFSPHIRPLKEEDASACLKLYSSWAEERLKKHKDSYYRYILEDSFFFQRRALLDFDKLDLKGIAVEIDGDLAGYSFGYSLDKEMFCIMAEVGNLKYKGISQYLFREFSRILEGFKLINAMDDAGLENLRKAKLSWRPLKINPIFTCQSST